MKKIAAVLLTLALAGQACMAEAAHRAGHPAKAGHVVKMKAGHQAGGVKKKSMKAHKAKAAKKAGKKGHTHRHVH